MHEFAVELARGQRIALIRNGGRSGRPPLLCIHGLPGCARDFEPLLEALGPHVDVLAYDRPGYGASRPLAADVAVGVEHEVGVLSELLDALSLAQVVLVGWSYGNAIACRAASDLPDRVRGVIALGGAGPSLAWPRDATDRLLYRSPLGDFVLRAATLGDGLLLRRSFDRAWGGHAPARTFERFLSGVRTRATRQRWLAEGRAWRPEEIEPPSAMPVLVLHGTEDAAVPISVARDFARGTECAELVELRGAGHWPFATHATAVADAVEAWMRAHVGAR